VEFVFLIYSGDENTLKEWNCVQINHHGMLIKPLRNGNVMGGFFTHILTLNYKDRRSTVTYYLNEKPDELSLKNKFLLLVLT
jgi:hypothetical protein